MAKVSMLREAIVASLSAAITVPLLWLLGGAINPERNVHSPDLGLAIMTIVGAGSILLLRSTWRDTAQASAKHDRRPDGREQQASATPYGGGCS